VPVAAVSAGVPIDEVPILMSLVGTPSFATTYDPAVVAAIGGAIQRATEKGIQ